MINEPVLHFALIGAGFWSRFQLAGWLETGTAQCKAVYNRTPAKAEALARAFEISAVYDDAAAMLEHEAVDFVDIVTGVETHREFVALAASRGLPVICQKPMATSLEEAEQMVQTCRQANVPLLINENWRWQAPLRQLHSVLGSGAIGEPFRARISMISGFPVFENQPALRQLSQFILTDLGSHTLDAARFLFGVAESLSCQTQRIHSDIQGEDVATVLLHMRRGATVVVEMAYAGNYLERDCFPETMVFVEGTRGSVEVAPDYWVRVTTAQGTHARRYPPPRYAWADPAYDLVHASIVPCQLNLLRHLRGELIAETTGEDNLQTVRLVFAAYEAASAGKVVRL